ncbi:MAG TPA: hypothetical protein VKQ08_11550 [Cyclobacteriaceae bacterium]|nr:hypothetical protein [Cyclobacteriaceae bacterium]
MGKAAQEEKMFKKEVGVYNRHRNFLSRETPPEQTKEALEELTNEYKKLLEQTRFLTWISGRLEKKLHRANRDLQNRNTLLEKTIYELISARASKHAYTIIYFIAIILFVLEEFLIEPVINRVGSGLGYSILIKLIIVLLLKVSEGFIEDRIKRKPKPHSS